MLRPAARPLHRPAQRAGGEQDRDVLREGLRLDAEAAADVARQHAHMRPLDVEDLPAEALHEVLEPLARADDRVAALSALGLPTPRGEAREYIDQKIVVAGNGATAHVTL